MDCLTAMARRQESEGFTLLTEAVGDVTRGIDL